MQPNRLAEETTATGDVRTDYSAEVYAVLKDRIVRWDYPPGHRLTEEELCREFGVSRVPVREALRRLEENKLVERVPYRGCSVKQPNLTEIHELYDVRLALELHVVAQLADEGDTSGALDPLVNHWQTILPARLADAPLDSLELAAEDEGFHEALAQATGNKTLLELLREINERLRFIRVADITTQARFEETCREHLAILAAVATGDTEAARQALADNINGGRRHVQAAIGQALANAYRTVD